MASDVFEEFLNALEKRPELRQRLLEILNLYPQRFITREELAEILDEIRKNRIESNQRFDKLIEELGMRLDKLIEENNKRFEQIDKRFEQMIEENNKRFEQMIEENNKRFEQIDKRFEQMIGLIEEERKERMFYEALIDESMAEFSSRFGKRAEDSLRKVVSEILKAEGIDETLIDHVQLIDEEGKYFIPGYITDIDIYYKGSKETWLMEYKARAKKDDILKLVKVGQLAQDVYRMKNVVLVLVTLRISDDLKKYAEDYGIKVIVGREANPRLLPPPKNE